MYEAQGISINSSIVAMVWGQNLHLNSCFLLWQPWNKMRRRPISLLLNNIVTSSREFRKNDLSPYKGQTRFLRYWTELIINNA
jgi:hypothetical protein